MINVTKTYVPDVNDYIEKVKKIFQNGWFTNNGEYLLELENKLKEFFQSEYVLLVANGTVALQLICKLFNLKGKVITTPFSFVASVSSFVWEGLDPVLADINKENFNMDPSNVEKLISKDVSAIVPVHVFGNPCNVSEYEKISRKTGIRIIYDASHAFDVKVNKKDISVFGDAVVYSFHSTKIFHTIEGGAVIVRSKELYERAKLLRNFGIPGYDMITDIGVNFKMNEFEAAMGLCVLNDIEKIKAGRKKIYSNYCEAFKNNEKLTLQKLEVNFDEYNYSYFPVLFENEEKLLEIKNIFNKMDIFPRRYFYPSLEKLPYLHKKQVVPIADDISRRILCLPVFHNLNESDQNNIINTIINHV